MATPIQSNVLTIYFQKNEELDCSDEIAGGEALVRGAILTLNLPLADYITPKGDSSEGSANWACSIRGLPPSILVNTMLPRIAVVAQLLDADPELRSYSDGSLEVQDTVSVQHTFAAPLNARTIRVLDSQKLEISDAHQGL